MSGTTISGMQTVPVTLTQASQNPLVVTGSGAVVVGNTQAIYGGAALAWTAKTDAAA